MIIPKYDEPWIAGIVCFEWSVYYAGGGGACGSSEGVRDVVIDVVECVRVGPDNGCIDGRVGRRDVAKEEISVPRWKRARVSPFVRWSERLSFVSMRSSSIKSLSTHSQMEKYLISICLVQGVGFWALPMAVHVSLSS